MKTVAKYNLFKGVSTLLTIGTPITVLLCQGEFFVEEPKASISAAGVLAILIGLLFCKDKIIEHFKMPAPCIVCACILVILYLIRNLMEPMELVCWITLATTGVDEFTFRRWYKRIDRKLPESAADYKKFGFLFTTTKTLEGDETK